LLLLLSPLTAFAGGILVIGSGKVTQYHEALAAARQVLRDGEVVDPDARDAANKVKRAAPSVILAVGQKALALARSAAPSTPTVFCMVLTAASSRTITGVKLEVAPAQQLSAIRQMDGHAKRVGVIYEPKASGAFLEEAFKAAGNLGLTLVARRVTDARGVRAALEEIADGIDALWLMPDPRLISAEMFNYLLVFTLERKIALFGFLDSFTQAGALASIAPDYQEIGRRAASMASELNGRAPAARLPVPPPVFSPAVISVNVKTARRLGIEIPQSAISKAKQVYR
jgi:putative ABC transport system substrate-binding protein